MNAAVLPKATPTEYYSPSIRITSFLPGLYNQIGTSWENVQRP